jgi:hypothetical protein
MMVNHCDAIVRVEAQMPDLSTSRASLNMLQPKVRDGMVVIQKNSISRGENVLAATNSTKMSLELI